MHKFTRGFLTEWRKLGLPFAGKTFIAAISGGADSVSLALALMELRNRSKLNLRIVLAHFNHKLRGEESDEDERFVKTLAERFECELACAARNPEFKIANQNGNLEQNARFARYEFLDRIAQNLDADGILTAHTLNDQAETFLLNLIRGSGLDGLGGIKPLRNAGFKIRDLKPEQLTNSEIKNQKSKIKLIRPLLRWAKRADTENFCRLNEVEFRSDSMNDDLAFKRVRIRKVLLPLLIDFNPQIVETLGKTAELLREDSEQLEIGNRNLIDNNLHLHSIKPEFSKNVSSAFETPLLQGQFSKAGELTVESEENLLLKDLKDVFPSMRRFIVRQWLKSKRGDLRRLTAKHFEAVENLIISRKSGQKVELPGKEIVVKKGGKLIYEKTEVEKS